MADEFAMIRFTPILGCSHRRSEHSGSLDYWASMRPDDNGQWVLYEELIDMADAAAVRNPFGHNEPSRQHMCTPLWFFKELQSRYRSDGDVSLDVCASKDDAVYAMYYSLDNGDNGLTLPWCRVGINFCNPPFSQAGAWVCKSIEEARRGCTSLLLLPYRAEAKWFFRHKHMFDVTLIVPRLNYYDPSVGKIIVGASFASCVMRISPTTAMRPTSSRNTIEYWHIEKPKHAKR